MKTLRDYINLVESLEKPVEQGVAEGLPQTLRKVVPGYAKREIDKKMDAGKFGKTDADKDANFQRYKKIQDKIKEQGVAEAAKWRDAKHKDKLYTQEPRDEDDYGSDDDYYNPKPDDYPGAKNLKGGGEYDHNDPLRKGYGRYGTGSMNTHGKRKGMPSRDQIRSLKGSIKDAHGKHPRPNLPEGKGNGK